MRKRNVSKLALGDKITLKHRLGIGTITQIAMTEEEGDGVGRYPMIRFYEEGVGTLWCTYRVIETHSRPLEAVK